MTREEALELAYNNRDTQVAIDRLLDNGYYVCYKNYYLY